VIVAALTLAIVAVGGAAQRVEAAIPSPRPEIRRVATPKRYCADVAMTDHRGPKRICMTAAKWRKLGVDPVMPKG
jgi:hypothetical protein